MKTLLFLTSLALPTICSATPISELGAVLQQSVVQSENQLDCREWEPNYLHMTVGASIAFEIPEILELQVVPQFTLIWTKD